MGADKQDRVGFGDRLSGVLLDVPPKQDRLQVGGVVSGVLTLPRRDLHLVRLAGVGDVRTEPVARPAGDLFAFAARLPGFPGAGVACHVPDVDRDQVTLAFAGRHNAFVNQGLQQVLDSWYSALTAQRTTHIIVSADAQAVTAATTSIDPAGGATGISAKANANVSRTNQTVHSDGTWTQADVAFAIRKIGNAKGTAATDIANIIGGSGGSAPYNEDFTIDLTSIAAWSLTMGIDVTATAS